MFYKLIPNNNIVENFAGGTKTLGQACSSSSECTGILSCRNYFGSNVCSL